jgi:hypothetical protein
VIAAGVLHDVLEKTAVSVAEVDHDLNASAAPRAAA